MGLDEENQGKAPTIGESPDDQPLALLANLSYPASNRFVPRIRASIERRLLVSHFAAGLWSAPLAVLLEFVCVGLGLFAVRADSRPRPGSRRE